MSRWQVIGVITGATVAVFSIMATIIGATWMLSESFHKEIAEIRVEIREENAETRNEFRKENNETRKDIGGLRTDIRGIDTKFDEFKESHRREHDLFRNPTAKKDEENSTSAN